MPQPPTDRHPAARVVHALPGRVRVHVPALRDGAGLEARVGAAAGVRAVRANARTGNVLVEFEPARVDAVAVAAVVALAAGSPAGVPRAATAPSPAASAASRARRSRTVAVAGVLVAGLDLALLVTGPLGRRSGRTTAMGPAWLPLALAIARAVLRRALQAAAEPAAVASPA